MIEFTPGPWKLLPASGGGLIVVRKGQALQIVPVADAHLIAAAPELLAALDALVACQTNDEGAISPEPRHRGSWLEAMVNARIALAKAEGR